MYLSKRKLMMQVDKEGDSQQSIYELRSRIRYQVGMCLQGRFKSVYTSAQSDQSLSFPPEEMSGPCLSTECH